MSLIDGKKRNCYSARIFSIKKVVEYRLLGLSAVDLQAQRISAERKVAVGLFENIDDHYKSTCHIS